MPAKKLESRKVDKDAKASMARISRRDFMKTSLMLMAGFATIPQLRSGQAAPQTATSDEEVLVAIASSFDKELSNLRAPLDAPLSYEQVDAIVRRALSMDTSPNALGKGRTRIVRFHVSRLTFHHTIVKGVALCYQNRLSVLKA